MFVIYGGLFCLLLGRILFIQITGQSDGVELAVKAAERYQRQETLEASRGEITDQQGNILAEDVLNYRMIAVVRESATKNPNYPEHVVDPEETAEILAEYIDLEEEQIYDILTKPGDPYQVEFGTPGANISHTVRNEILEHDLPGIRFIKEQKRYYPNPTFAPYVVGFTLPEQDGENYVLTGKMGIESKYNNLLKEVDGKVNYEKDSAGYVLPRSEKLIEPAQNGANIELTLDKTIQSFLEDALTRAYEKYDPENIVAIVANPKTGEILGMSQRPTFNLMTREGLDNWLNLAVEEVIEPGSTMKIFTLSAAIDSNNWHPNAYYQSGQYRLYDSVIRDHNEGRGWGSITYLEGFQRSSNTAMAYMLNIMGADTFIDYVEDFGFGQKTEVGLPKEAAGTILTKVPINKLTTAYGQGSTVTPIQLIQGATAVANDGKMMQPYVVKKVTNPETGEVLEENKPTVKGEPISATTAKEVREILASTVTSEYGTARAFEIEGYDVAGKTGTAQIPLENGKGYYWGKNNFLYSFLGMAPADDPQLVMYVAVKKPQLESNESGSAPSADIFNSVMEKSLKYLNIAPQDKSNIEKVKLKDYEGREVASVLVELQNDGVEPIIIGEGGKITEQYPKADTEVLKGNIVFLKTEGQSILPDFTGWSLRNVVVYKAMSKLPIEIVGEGFVESQSATPNEAVLDTSPIVVKLKTPEERFSMPTEQLLDEDEEILPQD